MQEIAFYLEKSGYSAFLPHRDGIELAEVNNKLMQLGYSLEDANALLIKAIFLIDTFQVADSDGLVLNLNGRVPDEGAIAEAGIAWALRKPVVIFKSDSRALMHGLDNPLVIGLSGFVVVRNKQNIPSEFERLFLLKTDSDCSPKDEINIGNLRKGRVIHKLYKNSQNSENNLRRFIKILSNDDGGLNYGVFRSQQI